MRRTVIISLLAVALVFGLTFSALAQDFQVQIEPVNPPIEFGFWGGWFQFHAWVVNNTNQNTNIDLWAMLDFPSGDVYGPINGGEIWIAAGDTMSCRNIDQRIPGCMEAGVYTYVVYIGDYIWGQDPVIYDSSSLNFTIDYKGDGGIDCDGKFELKGCFENNDAIVVKDYDIRQNYPNPFNAQTTIVYQTPESGNVRLDIYDILGRRIKTLVNGFSSIGPHRVIWDGTNNNGETVSTGIYFYRLYAENGTAITKRLTLIK